MDFRTLRLQIDGPIARITLSRADLSNRVDLRLIRELQAACETIAADDALRVVLVAADGADFCSGWDEPALEALLHNPEIDPFGCLASLAVPVVAAVQGAAFSAGLELALACDVRIASEDARFALPEVEFGRLPLAGGSQRLPRLVGRSVATSMLLLAEQLDAQAAYRAGLVSRVLPNAELATQTESLVQRIASHGPLALRYAKEAVHHGSELSLDQALRYELDLSVILQTTQDREEGVNAFIEKRQPKFEGR